jgi:hypothetical protein
MVEPVQQGHAASCVSAYGPDVKTGFGVELGHRHARRFIQELG